MSPEIFKQFEFLIGSVGVILSFFLAAILLLFKNRSKANVFLMLYLLAWGFRIGKSLFHNYFDLPPTLRTMILSLLFCVGPSLWLFVRFSLQPKLKLDPIDWWHYGLFVLMLPVCWYLPNDGSSAYFAYFYNGTILHMMAYCIYAICWFYHKKREKEALREKLMFNWLQLFLWTNLIFLIWYLMNSLNLVPYYMGLSIFYSLIIIVFGIWALQLPDLFKVPLKKYQESTLSKTHAAKIMHHLDRYMEDERPYLDLDLNLAKLSQLNDTSPKELSQAINQIKGLNYSQYIAQYRIKAAQKMLGDPAYDHYKIAAIAYECGFNSISSFNAQFKKATGFTAKAYRSQKKGK